MEQYFRRCIKKGWEIVSEWYTYDEFAIDLSEVEDILDSEFLEKLGR